MTRTNMPNRMETKKAHEASTLSATVNWIRFIYSLGGVIQDSIAGESGVGEVVFSRQEAPEMLVWF